MKPCPTKMFSTHLPSAFFSSEAEASMFTPASLCRCSVQQTAAHVDPAVRHPGVIEVFGDDRRRDQLAVGHDRIVPQFGVAGFVDGLRRDLFQFAEQRVDRRQPLRLVPQFVDDLRMVLRNEAISSPAACGSCRCTAPNTRSSALVVLPIAETMMNRFCSSSMILRRFLTPSAFRTDAPPNL